MSVRWRIEQDTRFNVPVRVDITDANYVGSIINLQFAGKSPVIKTGGVRNSDPYKKIFGESITVNLKAQTGDFEDLFTRDRDRFRIKLYVNGSFDSEYIPITDAYSEPVTGGNFISTIKGAGLASLKQIKATDILTADNYSALEAIYELTNHFFNYSIVDGTIFYPDGSNTTTSALSQIDIKTARFEDESAYQALEYLISRSHQIRVQDGSAHVIPAKESSYTGYSYNGSTISSGVTYDTNLSAQPIGGRTAINRRRQQYYDGVLRTYEPGSAGNIVPSGDFSEAEFSGITGEEVPAGWSYDFTSPVLTNQPISSRAFDGEEYAWQFNPTEWLSGVGEPRYFQATGEQIISGERLSVNAELKFNKEKSSSQVLIFLLEIKIGSHYLIQQSDQSGRINNPKNLVWSTSPPSRTSGEGSYLRISVPQNIRQRFTVNAPPAPVSGQISYRVAVSTFNGGYSKDDTINIYTISNEIVDEDGKVTSKSEHSIGTGDIYNFTEYFGDGFTSATPGALFYNNSPTEFWSAKGISGTGTLAQVQSSYIQSEISRDNDLYFGTYDVYDAISLIEGKRVGYISTDYRYGVSKIELLGIEQHSISTTGDDDEDKDGITVGPGIEFPEDLFAYYQLNAIGETTQDYEDATITSLAVDLDQPIRSGIEYFVVNENELDSLDRDLGIYPFIPDLSGGERVDYGPGELSVAIQEQVINAPSGSLIVKSSTQGEFEQNIYEFKIIEAEAELVSLDGDVSANASSILTLDSRVTETETDIIANADAILAAETRLDDAESDISAQSSSILTLESESAIYEADLNNAQRQATAPSTRPSGEPLKIGDTWIDTDDDDRVYIYDGTTPYDVSGWIKGNKLIDTNASAILAAESRITDNETNITANADSILTLDSRVTVNEGDIDANASAILSAESSISNLQTDAGHIFRQDAEPTVRPSGESLVEGDLWIDTDDNDKQYYYTGTAWVTADATASLNLDSRVTTVDGKVTNISAKAALVVDAGGTIGSIDMTADGLTGFSEIDISADQVKINNMVFNQDPGELTNVDGDFRIDSSGYKTYLSSTTTSDPARSYAVTLSETDDSLRAAMWASGGLARFESYGGFVTQIARRDSSNNITQFVNIGGIASGVGVTLDPGSDSVRLALDNDLDFETVSSSSTSPSTENGRIGVKVNGTTRWIKLYS